MLETKKNFAPYIALNRFGLGAAPQEAQSIIHDPQKWIKLQIQSPSGLSFDYALPATEGLIVDLLAYKKLKGSAEKTANDPKKQAAKKYRALFEASLEARLYQNINSPTPFIERMVLFWSNFFTVSVAGKTTMGGFDSAFERDAIRPYVVGRFEDMLLAATQHPAMLHYLNNATSVGPNSPLGSKKDAGLNENLARETLELHSVGVNGGYTQKDVIALAKIITGWTIAALKPKVAEKAVKGRHGFVFVQGLHEPGPQTLMGQNFPQTGLDQGVSALKFLAHHPSTAKYIAEKLLRHFGDDQPAASDVDAIANVYYRTGGDLKEVYYALTELSSIWNRPMSKVKTPYELIISTCKALGLKQKGALPFPKILEALLIMNQAPFSAPSPAGWSDNADDWISGSSMMNRIEWCHAVSKLINIDLKPSLLAQSVLGEALTPQTLQQIERAPSGQDGLALFLASPEFQRR